MLRPLTSKIRRKHKAPLFWALGANVARSKELEIRRDDLESPQVTALVLAHLASLEPTAPPESRHALDLNGLRSSEVSFWVIWDGENVAGIGALKRLSEELAEIKSMRTADSYRRQGVGSRMLRHLMAQAIEAGYKQISLETGSMEFFEPARKLYSSFGFTECGPFGDYVEDPNSVFMTRYISSNRA